MENPHPSGSIARLMFTALLPHDCEQRQAARRVLAKRRERGQPELQGVVFEWERDTV